MNTSRKRPRYFTEFIQSREAMGCSSGTLQFYSTKIGGFLSQIDPNIAKPNDINRFLLQFNNMGNRNAYFRAIKTFFNWLYQNYDISSPIKNMPAPKIPRRIMPTLTKAEIVQLLYATIYTDSPTRNNAIITLFVESGLRLSELTNIQIDKINWNNRTIQIIGKGNREELAPFGEMSEKLLKIWLGQYQPGKGNIWGIDMWGISSMLRRLREKTGLQCNPHVFRRTFACLLREAGIDVLTIKQLGRWESIEMVERYTRSFTFNDSLKFYKGPLS